MTNALCRPRRTRSQSLKRSENGHKTSKIQIPLEDIRYVSVILYHLYLKSKFNIKQCIISVLLLGMLKVCDDENTRNDPSWKLG